MTPALVAGIGLLGGVGAVARFVLSAAVSERAPGTAERFPIGILVVNLLGSFALGALAGAVVSPDVERLAGTGLIGAFTTFSTWMFDTHGLAVGFRPGHDHRPRAGAFNIAVSLGLGIAAVWLGRKVGGALA